MRPVTGALIASQKMLGVDNITNKGTRLAYARTVGQFLTWYEARGLALDQIQPVVVATYIEQHLAAIRLLFD